MSQLGLAGGNSCFSLRSRRLEVVGTRKNGRVVDADVRDSLNGVNYNGWLCSKKQRGKIECLFQLI